MCNGKKDCPGGDDEEDCPIFTVNKTPAPRQLYNIILIINYFLVSKRKQLTICE